MNAAIIVFGTGKYYNLLMDSFLPSAREHWQGKVTYVTDPALPWPLPTLLRFEFILEKKELLQDYDYLYLMDADFRFVAPVGEDLISERVASLHWANPRTFEDRPESAAYVPPETGMPYYHCCPCGGEREWFLGDFVPTVAAGIREDLARGIIARWHDESHVNRYWYENPSTLVLGPEYSCPQRLHKQYPDAKILDLDTDKPKELRQ